MVSNVNKFAMMGLVFPMNKILEPKGIVPIVIEHKEEIVNDIKEKVVSHFSISEWLGIKDKIAEIATSLHQQALLTPDLNDDKIDFMKYLYDHANSAPATHFAPEWFKDIIVYITAVIGTSTHNAIQASFRSIYKFVVDIVLMTPDWLFEGAWFSDTIIKFTEVNMSLVVVFTMIQGIKRMLNKKHTTLKDIMKRLPIALTVSAAAPILFTQGIKWLNKFTHFIIGLAGGVIGSDDTVIISPAYITFDFFNMLIMLIFLAMVIFQFFPLITFHGRRWFNILIQGILTPFAMTAYIFEETRHYFDTWFSAIKDTCKKQLIYAVFVALLGIIIFVIPNPTTMAGLTIKSILTIGGLHTIAHPPNIVMQYAERGKGIINSVKDLNNKRKAIWNGSKNFKIQSENTAVKTAGITGKVLRFFKILH